MIKSSPETKTNADWLKEELIVCLGILFEPGFSVSAIVCDNHSSNGSNFKNLLQHFNQDPDDLFIWYELRKIYLFHNVVHLVKNEIFFLHSILLISKIPSTFEVEK